MRVIQKTWGREEIIENGAYCAKKLIYDRPIASSLHYHIHKHETFVVASGIFELEVGDLEGRPARTRRMEHGDSVVLPPNTRHRIRCISPGFIVEASTTDNPEDCVRLVPSET